MVKVKITRDCAIKGKHYGAGDMAEAIEKDADYLMGKVNLCARFLKKVVKSPSGSGII